MKVTPAAFPAPGATITPAYLHALVDDATLNEFVPGDFNDLGGGLSAGDDGTVNAWMRQPTTYEVYRQPISTVSISVYGTRQLYGKVDLAYYKNTKGWQPTKGNVCHVPSWGDNTRQDWSGYTAMQSSGSWNLPRISIDMKHWNHVNGWAFPGTDYPDVVYHGQTWGIVDENGPADGVTKVCQYGYCDAYIHAGLSTELTLPGSVFGLLFNYTDGTRVPVSMAYAATPGFTADIYPLGVVRQVYTDSGVTSVPFILESASPGATSMNCYVAKIFLGGGTPCL